MTNNSENIERKALSLPEDQKDLLLLVCCAPCAGEVIEALAASPNINTKVLFYNPNIVPEVEYLKRKEEFIHYANKYNLEIIDADYDNDNWHIQIKGLENEPERGGRCMKCFYMRLNKTAEIAKRLGIRYFASTLGISRWKSIDQVNLAGQKAEANHEGVKYWDHNWRKGGGGQRMYVISKKEEFYMQDYCGCEYSFRKPKATPSDT